MDCARVWEWDKDFEWEKSWETLPSPSGCKEATLEEPLALLRARRRGAPSTPAWPAAPPPAWPRVWCAAGHADTRLPPATVVVPPYPLDRTRDMFTTLVLGVSAERLCLLPPPLPPLAPVGAFFDLVLGGGADTTSPAPSPEWDKERELEPA